MSLSIYNTKPSTKHHYVYQITEISTNKKYIGVRSSDVIPCLDLGVIYFSSSTNKEFIKSQKENSDDYMYEVLYTFDNRLDATKKESDLHELYDVKNNDDYYNKCNQTYSGFDTTGIVTVKDELGNILRVKIDDPRYLSGELVSNMMGLFHAKDEFGRIYTILRDDPRYLSGELVGLTKGKKMSDKHKEAISVYWGKSMLGKNHKQESIDAMKDKKKGANNPRARSVSIDGVVYTTILEASKVHNTYPHTVRRRLNSTNDKWESWFYL